MLLGVLGFPASSSGRQEGFTQREPTGRHTFHGNTLVLNIWAAWDNYS